MRVMEQRYPLISIIVPVYNAEICLERCVDSVLKQQFYDFELLLVDDGSTDRSGTLCDEYALQDERVRAFHKENGGVSSARNLALNEARGEWVTFVDADDYLVENSLDIDWPSVSAADLILFPYYQNGVLRKIYIPSGELSVLSNSSNWDELRTPWAKMFKRELIDGIRFDENMKVCEDTLFVLRYLKKVSKIEVQNSPSYYYSLPEDDFWNKYKMDVSSSICSLKKIYSAYEDLGIKQIDFEANTFFVFKTLCADYIDENPDEWFRNRDVKRIYKQVKRGLAPMVRIKYFLLSINLITKAKVRIRKCLKGKLW